MTAPHCPNPECGDTMFRAQATQAEQVREVWRCRNLSCGREVPITDWRARNAWAEARAREGDL